MGNKSSTYNFQKVFFLQTKLILIQRQVAPYESIIKLPNGKSIHYISDDYENENLNAIIHHNKKFKKKLQQYKKSIHVQKKGYIVFDPISKKFVKTENSNQIFWIKGFVIYLN